MSNDATRRAIALVTAQIDDITTGAGLAGELFGEAVGDATNDRDAWEQTMALAVGLLNVGVVLVDRLAETTGRTPSELMADVALQLETMEDGSDE
jgi:hypothetical protein